MPSAVILVALVLQAVTGHRPVQTQASCDDDFGSSQTALFVPDSSLSWSFEHYLDCTHRAVWTTWVNAKANQTFYIGAGTPTMSRFADLRPDVVIIGPGLPALSSEDMAYLPEEVRSDPVWSADVGAILRKSPTDQSSCGHLGDVMFASSEVRNGRCDFYEEYGSTNSWWLLDADYNQLPDAGATYYAAVFLKEHTSGKLGIAVGTWVENFVMPFELHTPSCKRRLTDFAEKEADQGDCLPTTACDSLTTAIPNTDCTLSAACIPTTCEDVIAGDALCTQGGDCDCDKLITNAMAIPNVKTKLDACSVQALTPSGEVFIWDVCAKTCDCTRPMTWCGDAIKGNAMCTFGNQCECSEVIEEHKCGGLITSAMGNVEVNDVCAKSCDTCPMKTTCGGDKCSSAVEIWEEVANKMHKGMAIEFSCNADLDFVYGMIPHHEGALAMCEALLKHLMCPETQDMGGLVHFCGHVRLEQEREVTGMQTWLEEHGHSSKAVKCEQGGSDMVMGCGNTSCESSKEFMAANHLMHMAMMVDISCEHDVDFVRGMIPHHAGAVEMCRILESTTADAYLIGLCENITRVQYAEIDFMSKWLLARKKLVGATCETCSMPTQPPETCEDLLPTSSFCHTLKGDLNCKCEDAVQQYPCGTVTDMPGFGVFNTSAECMRTCGHCPAERPPLFHQPCGAMDHGDHTGHDMGGHDGHDHGDHDGHDHSHQTSVSSLSSSFYAPLAFWPVILWQAF